MLSEKLKTLLPLELFILELLDCLTLELYIRLMTVGRTLIHSLNKFELFIANV